MARWWKSSTFGKKFIFRFIQLKIFDRLFLKSWPIVHKLRTQNFFYVFLRNYATTKINFTTSLFPLFLFLTKETKTKTWLEWMTAPYIFTATEKKVSGEKRKFKFAKKIRKMALGLRNRVERRKLRRFFRRRKRESGCVCLRESLWIEWEWKREREREREFLYFQSKKLNLSDGTGE